MRTDYDTGLKATVTWDDTGRIRGILYFDKFHAIEKLRGRAAAEAYIREIAKNLHLPPEAVRSIDQPVSYVDPLGREHVQEPGFTVPYSQWNEKLKDMWPDLNNCLPRPLRMTKGKACRAACWALTATIPFVCPETFPGSFVCAAGIIAAASYCADGCPR